MTAFEELETVVTRCRNCDSCDDCPHYCRRDDECLWIRIFGSPPFHWDLSMLEGVVREY